MDKKQRNGLEVTCIGSLYQGPWEKKYWSSSRGKDRYPYPVGFHAVRCYNGETYQMEIHEGTRGPLFVVSFGDKMTCSGDTPTIAWQNAMKKLNSHSRKANQRLLNANSNGSELFGFLNPLVQRLFRELVSSQDGEAHRSDELYEALSQNREEMKQERKAVEQDESKALPTNLSWQSTKGLSVRKSRTSIVNSSKYMSGNSKLMTDSSERSRLQREPGTCKTAAKDTLGCSPLEDHADISHPEQSHNPSAGRKRLRLLKPTKIAEQSSPNNKPSSCLLPEPIANSSSPDLLLNQSDSEQGIKQDDKHFICGINSSNDIKRHKLNSSSKDVNANKAVNLETMAVVIPDSFDDLSSQIVIRDTEQVVSSLPHSSVLKQDPKNGTPFLDSHRSATFQEDRLVPDTFDELSQVYKERGKEQEPPTSKKIIPVIETNLDKSICPENKNEDSNLLIKGEEKLQLMMNVLVPDSCDTENVAMLSKDASKSTGGGIINSQGLLVEIPGDSMLLECTTKSLEGTPISSQGSLEQNPVDTYKGSSHYSALDNSQWSENNMEKCESDSLGQEITKSMITLLLPQALQLLEKKRKRKIKSIIPPSVDESHKQLDATCQANDVFDKNMKSVNDGLLDTSAVRCDGGVKDKCNMVEKYCPQHSENSRCNSSVREPCKVVVSIETDEFYSSRCPNVKDLVPLDQELDGVHDAVTVDGISRDSAIANSSSVTGKNDSKRFEMHATPPGNLEKCDDLELFRHEMRPQSSISLHVDKPLGNFNSTKSEDFPHPDAENILDSGCQNVCPSPAHYLDSVHGSTDFKSTVLEVNDALCHARVLAYLPTIETNASEQPDSEKSLCFYSAPDKNVSSPDSKFEMPCSSLAFKRHLPQSDYFEPKACLEHPMPVLVMKVHVQNDDIRFFVLCGYPNRNLRTLFVYNVTEKGVGLSLINSINLNVLECGCDVPHIELAETNGICFTPDGQELVLLGTFSINRERDHSDERSALVSQKTKCLHGVALVCYTNSEPSVHTELSSFGRHLYSLLVCNPYMVIAGGENGFVSGWEMDSIWRNCKKNFILPVPEGFELSHVIQLLAVPHYPYLVVGCDDRSIMAIWNISNHQLLRTSSLFVVSPLEVHILEIDIMNQQQNDGIEINTKFDWKFEETGDIITVSLLCGTLSRNDSNSLSSTEKTFSRTWTLEVFQRDGNTRVFLLDMDQRVSAMSIMDRLGIAGTYDGYVYIWDTIKGSIKQTYKDFEGVPIACIASNWACDVVVVADVNARVMIYMKQASM